MKISRDRLIQIIKEELDDQTKELYQKDPEGGLAIMQSEEAIHELKVSIYEMKMILQAEWAVANKQGYSADHVPDIGGLEESIEKMEEAVLELEKNIKSELSQMHQRKE